MQNNFQKFQKYVNAWKELDKFRLNWWLKYLFYLPFGFILEMINLNKKHKLTSEYKKHVEEYGGNLSELNNLGHKINTKDYGDSPFADREELLSTCCSAPIINQDLCGKCREHC